MRKKYSDTKTGLFALGYIQNQGSYLSELAALAGSPVTAGELDENTQRSYATESELNYSYDAAGNVQCGEYDEKKTCRYAIETGFLAPNPNPQYPDDKIYAVFQKDGYGQWSGVKFFTRYRLENALTAYRFGNLSFKTYAAANAFIVSLESILLPGETWKFRNSSSEDYRPKTEYDILQSYLQYVFEKLLADYNTPDSKNYKKIVFSTDRRRAIFNSGLLNKFAQDVYLLGDVFGPVGGRFTLSNLLVAPSKVDLIRTYGFAGADLTPYPGVVEFFHKLDDIIYDSDIEIDLSADRLSHIIEDGARRNRFAEKYTAMYAKGDLPAITSTLETAIENARKIAKRNYKFVVPQYRSAHGGEPGKIQFLMPIYLDRQYGEKPDFALVLNSEVMPDGTRYYTPETILELPWAYNNARVICKPEDTWLNPETIDSPPADIEPEAEDSLD
ncbi:MAG TPA: DUF3825 domain-containing protein [Candidatus Acidoferrum sp.]|nr:DUF3825 domain-containing protein [Candidatus Acidoferrum sp.]